MYCGKNILRKDEFGTNYSCLKKGIKISENKTKDNYEIYLKDNDLNKIYCGKSENLPAGYNNFGDLPQCLSKGFGIGKSKNFKKNLKNLITEIDNILSK